MKNIYVENNSQSVSQVVRPKFYDLVNEIAHQIELPRLNCDQRLALEICKTVAEVLILSPEREMKIGDDILPVGLVQDVYRSLTAENVELVIESFKNVRTEVRNIKAYMRTALYNSAFEIGFHYLNQFECEL